MAAPIRVKAPPLPKEKTRRFHHLIFLILRNIIDESDNEFAYLKIPILA